MGTMRASRLVRAARAVTSPLEKIGATSEGTHRKHMPVRGGERRDSAWYAVIADDWPAVKSALEQQLGLG